MDITYLTYLFNTPLAQLIIHIFIISIFITIPVALIIYIKLRSQRINSMNNILDRKYDIKHLRNNINKEYEEHKYPNNNINNKSILNLSTIVSASDILYHYNKIDDKVIDSIYKAHGEKAFYSYKGLSHHIDEVASRGNESWNGIINQYKGYLGETTISEYLRGQHPDIVDAPFGNKGWDVSIGGEEYQIKSGLDPNHILKHRENYPDIPVITVSEHADMFSNDDMVIIVPISGEELENLTKDTLHGIRDLDDAGIDFPIVTFLASCYRNSISYSNNQIGLFEATKNTAIDVTSVGVGGYLGFEIGSAIGEFFGEAATSWLEIIGGRLGAMAAREGINYLLGYKYRTLNKYIKESEILLLNLPSVYLDSLKNKRYSIINKATKIKPSGVRYVLWPNMSDIINLRTYNTQLVLCNKYESYENHLINKLNNNNADKKSIAISILQNEMNYPVINKKYQHIKKELAILNNKITEEKKRLDLK